MSEKVKRINVRIEPEMYTEAERIAKQEPERDISKWIRGLIREAIEKEKAT
jgi:metal-responsive CopG/Arc/MetJ family transcriptional regulator